MDRWSVIGLHIGAAPALVVAAGACALADRLLTVGYFIPTMLALLQMADSPGTVAVATRWSALNYFRHGLVLAA